MSASICTMNSQSIQKVVLLNQNMNHVIASELWVLRDRTGTVPYLR